MHVTQVASQAEADALSAPVKFRFKSLPALGFKPLFAFGLVPTFIASIMGPFTQRVHWLNNRTPGG